MQERIVETLVSALDDEHLAAKLCSLRTLANLSRLDLGISEALDGGIMTRLAVVLDPAAAHPGQEGSALVCSGLQTLWNLANTPDGKVAALDACLLPFLAHHCSFYSPREQRLSAGAIMAITINKQGKMESSECLAPCATRPAPLPTPQPTPLPTTPPASFDGAAARFGSVSWWVGRLRGGKAAAEGGRPVVRWRGRSVVPHPALPMLSQAGRPAALSRHGRGDAAGRHRCPQEHVRVPGGTQGHRALHAQARHAVGAAQHVRFQAVAAVDPLPAPELRAGRPDRHARGRRAQAMGLPGPDQRLMPTGPVGTSDADRVDTCVQGLVWMIICRSRVFPPPFHALCWHDVHGECRVVSAR